MHVKIKRVYEKPDKADGARILVDRLWPRGLTKAKARVHLWLKDIAPSAELRKWFGHDPDKWVEFKKRYHAELKKNGAQVALLKEEIKKGVVTLVYGAKDEEHNEAVVLARLVQVAQMEIIPMAHDFKVGDQVEWNSEAGRVRGTIKKKVTSEITFKGYKVHASEEEPQYLIESDKTDHLAMHKGSALKKIGKGKS
jgi:uncharacterized protein YeaO (DUF488 family)